MILRLATRAMGTRFELVLSGDDPVYLRATGEEALAEIEQVESRLSLFRRDSLLSHINRVAHAAPVRLDLDTFGLFETIDRTVRESRGAFDPTVAPLMRSLGLHGEDSGAPLLDLADAHALVGWDSAILLDPNERSLRFTREGVSLDLGGIAKGHGLDLAATSLRENGILSALLHGGTSSIVALGAPEGRQGWSIALGGETRPVTALLRDAALSVSAPSGRRAVGPLGEVHHLVDPRSARPAKGSSQAAVIAAQAATADAWSTALVIDPALAPGLPFENLLTGEGSWSHNLPPSSPTTPRFRLPQTV